VISSFISTSCGRPDREALMAGAGYRDWVAGDVPTATQFDTYLQEQTVMVFASEAARDSALSTAKSEGMLTYQLDTNRFSVYSGAAWSSIGPAHGALTTWTPTVTQSGSVTVTNTSSTYQRNGRLVTCRFQLSVTGSGSANNPIIIGGLPVTGAHSFGAIGSGYLFDASVSFYYPCLPSLGSTATVHLLATSTNSADNRLGSTGNPFASALASGDVLTGEFRYEAAADA
jgi:hypothetical protein